MLPDDGKRKKAVVQQSFPLRLIHYGGSRGGVRMEKTIIIRITNPTKAQDALLQRLVRAFRAEHIWGISTGYLAGVFGSVLYIRDGVWN